MDKNTANALILKLWSIDEKLVSIRRDIEAVEHVVADQVTEE